MHVLVVDAARPFSNDGLAARAGALGSVNVSARAVATDRAGGCARSVRAAVEEGMPDVVLAGRVPDEDADAVADALRACDARVVVDASVAPEALLAAADVAVADASVAARFGAPELDGERPVVGVLQDLLDRGAEAAGLLAGDGSHDGFKNPTGLRLSGPSGSPPTETSALVAGLLASGYEAVEAWNEARLSARRLTDGRAAPSQLPAHLRCLMAEHAHATFILEEHLNPRLVPPQGANLALAARDAEDAARIVDVEGRLVAAGDGVRMAGARRLAGDSCAVRALLAARRVERGVRVCVTLHAPWDGRELSEAAGLDVTDARSDGGAPVESVTERLRAVPPAVRGPEGRLFVFASDCVQLLQRASRLGAAAERLSTSRSGAREP